MASLIQPLIQNEDLQKQELIELVLAAQGGDRLAFGELFQRFERHVFAIALRRLGDFGDAQELTQDVFIQAIRKIDQLRAPEAFGGWLRSIVHRMAINRIARREPDRPVEPETLSAVCVENETPLTAALAIEQQRQVRAGLARLGELDRQTLEAFYVRGQSLIEMSDEFDAPVGTIKRRLHVARKRLAKEVELLAV
jgi:RNA polymerase sigma-70 factor (ECF subfamily)